MTYIVACYNVWNDDRNLEFSIRSLIGHVDFWIFIVGPYKDHPQNEKSYDEKIAIAKRTREMIFKLVSQPQDDGHTFTSALVVDLEDASEIQKRNAYMQAFWWNHPEILEKEELGTCQAIWQARGNVGELDSDLWMLIMDSDEMLAIDPHLSLRMMLDATSAGAISIPNVSRGYMLPDRVIYPLRLIRVPGRVTGRLEYKGNHYSIFHDIDDLSVMIKADTIMPELQLMHLQGNRHPERRKQNAEYYQKVEAGGLEEHVGSYKLLKLQRNNL